MSAVVTRARNRLGSKHMSASYARDLLKDPRTWCCVGIVAKHGGDHFEILEDNGTPVDVLVEVDLMPQNESVTCRLAACAGGPGGGLWKVPPVGAEVYVAIPGGEVEGGPVIVAVLSCRDVPSALDEDTLVLLNPKKVIIASKDEKVYLGSVDGTGTKPAARKDDSLTASSALATWAGTVETVINSVASGTFTSANQFAGTLPANPGKAGNMGSIATGSDKVEVK